MCTKPERYAYFSLNCTDLPIPGHARPGSLRACVQAVAPAVRHTRALETCQDEEFTCKTYIN